MQPKKLLQVLFLSYGMPWFLGALAGVIIFLTLGFAWDPKFFVLSLIWVFLVMPLVVAFLYFFYGMDPLTAFNAIPHTLCFSPSGLTVRIISRGITSQDEGKEEIEPEESMTKEYHVGEGEFREMKTGSDYVLLFFGKKGWIYLPVAAFNSTDDFKEVVNSFIDK